MGDNKPFRYTRGKLSVETTLTLILLAWLWRATTWGYRRWKPVFYHPVALGGSVAAVASYMVSPWLTALGALSALLWPLVAPHSYLHHAQPRIDSFKTGWRYRHRPRRRLTACGLLNDKDPTPTISDVHKIGCITKVRIKMLDGDEIDMWRVRSAQLAQTYNALDCKVNPYRRKELNPFSKRMVTKPRWLVLDFLTRDPFNSGLGIEYINYHAQPGTLEPVVSTYRDGTPREHNLAAHRLRVAMTRWGKSNAIRAMVYSQRNNIKNGVLELWGIDGKGGVEQSFMQHVFARVAYGDTPLNPHAYNPAEFDKLLKDAVVVLKRRQRSMRGNNTEHTPTETEPWLLIVIDELLVLTSKAIPAEMRNSIAASIMVIQQQGIACGVSLDASTQLAQKDKIDFRDGFTEFEVGKVERGAVDMIFGTGWWERGARADEISKDLKGTFYVKTDSTMVPAETRYPAVAVDDVSPRALGFTVDKSALWPPRLQLVKPQPASPNGHTPTTNGQHQPQPVKASTNGHQPDSDDLVSASHTDDSGFGGFA
jgi:S-DNA-T family DNA segregation ATPase FtsK/SpoIIIE